MYTEIFKKKIKKKKNKYYIKHNGGDYYTCL